MNLRRFIQCLAPVCVAVCAVVSHADTIASGYYHTLLVRSDGSMWSWGRNALGQLGIGSTDDQLLPFQITTLTNASAIAGGQYHSLAVTSDGKVYAWGLDQDGQLGDGGVDYQQNSPVLIDHVIGTAIEVAAGQSHSLALTNDGHVWAWGSNGQGQLGDGSGQSQYYPVQLTDANLTDVVVIAAGKDFSVALKNDGSVWTWGSNAYGQLGTGNAGGNSATPVQCQIDHVVAISAGQQHAVALKDDGHVWSWGASGAGQLGNGVSGNGTYSATPVEASQISTATAIAAGQFHTLAVMGDGSLKAWGLNTNGALGNDSTISESYPVTVHNIGGVTSVAADFHSLAISNYDGVSVIWTWGANGYGQIGDGTTFDRLSPVGPPFDADEDGLSDWEEYLWNSDPLNPDTNGDVLPDCDDVLMGFDPSELDLDADGIPNAEEYMLGTNPFWDDTDGDGFVDGQDAFPLDPTRSQPWPPDPNDHTPPVITITFPTTGVTPL
jgi:Regulator of chromosome condensation (RCC1) repeat/Bacterial TSP3 repeat